MLFTKRPRHGLRVSTTETAKKQEKRYRKPLHTPSTDLTEREEQVLRLRQLGSGPKAIGRALGISLKTADAHLQNIRRKKGSSICTERPKDWHDLFDPSGCV